MCERGGERGEGEDDNRTHSETQHPPTALPAQSIQSIKSNNPSTKADSPATGDCPRRSSSHSEPQEGTNSGSAILTPRIHKAQNPVRMEMAVVALSPIPFLLYSYPFFYHSLVCYHLFVLIYFLIYPFILIRISICYSFRFDLVGWLLFIFIYPFICIFTYLSSYSFI